MISHKFRPYWRKFTVLFDPWGGSVNKCLLPFVQIQQANSTAYLAARQISESLRDLFDVTTLRETVESTLGAEFQSMYHNNSLKLEEIGRINSILLELVSIAQSFGEKASMDLTKATEIASQALSESRKRKGEVETALYNASDAHLNAELAKSKADTVLNTAMKFKVSILLWSLLMLFSQSD